MSITHRILVVDDMDAGRFVKTQILRRAGFDVVEASTGTEALRIVTADRPDLVVLDVNLPDINGLEVSRRLRLLDLAGLQILQISNTATAPGDRVRGLEHGADVYLVEPVESDVLIATVQALLRVNRAERALEDALDNERRARQIAEEASRLKDDFIATLSHELRTPLNALMGWIWQLKNSRLTDEARERALNSLERNGRMQAQLINDLLDVSRVSKGKLHLEMRLVDLENVVLASCDVVRDAVMSKCLDLEVHAATAPVTGDRGRLQQIVTNLLSNAVQFTPQRGRITLTLTSEGDVAVLTVTDTGSGIDPAFLPHVFDPFRQGGADPSRKHGGLGLGLAVVRQLIDLHGGSVAVASRGLGCGATFTVRLPLETALSPPAGGTDSELLLKQVDVLLLLGDDGMRHALRDMLEASGAKVNVALTDDEEPAAASLRDADVIVTAGAGGQHVIVRQPGALDDDRSATATVSIAQPADIVRRMARMVVQKRVRTER